MNKRLPFLLGVLGLLLVGLAGWSWSTMASARAAALANQRDLHAVHQAAGQIEQMRDQPSIAAEQEHEGAETIALIEQAARVAGIADIGGITHEKARRVGDTAYKETSIQVLLRKVTLRQVVDMAYELMTAPSALQARAVRLSAPRQDEGDQDWNVDLVLSYLIYEPPRLDGQGG